ncbi:integrase protein [Rhizobium phage RHph_I20]|uniref:Integrase n=1 Tax=Rhizobium phage RHph_I20 TaxID=2509730 RepID=A0A7S5RL90_9CAUD|nr:integrase protein [Rhizobium phage RHph_I20]
MTISPRGSAFKVDVKVGAKHNPTKKEVRVRVSAKDMSTARRLEAEIRAAVMKHGVWNAESASASAKASRPGKAAGTLGAALEEAWNYPSGRNRGWKFQKSGKEQYNKAKMCIAVLGKDRHCATVTPDDLNDLVNTFAAKGNSNETITFKIQALFRVLWHAQRKGWITHRPLWDRPAPGNPREFIFSPDLEAKTIEYFGDFEQDLIMRDLFILGIETGLRIGELLLSRKQDWILDNRVHHVRPEVSKNKRARYVTLSQRAIDTIRPYIENKPDSWQPFRWSKSQIAYKMRKARKFFDMEENAEFCFHATRHTRATRLARATRDPFVVMSQLGHSSITISMRYIKMAALDLEALANIETSSAPSLPHPNVATAMLLDAVP